MFIFFKFIYIVQLSGLACQRNSSNCLVLILHRQLENCDHLDIRNTMNSLTIQST